MFCFLLMIHNDHNKYVCSDQSLHWFWHKVRFGEEPWVYSSNSVSPGSRIKHLILLETEAKPNGPMTGTDSVVSVVDSVDKLVA